MARVAPHALALPFGATYVTTAALAEHPDARGLTVSGMPLGSLGMDAPNPEHYKALLVGEDGSTNVLAAH
jgi:hypothetical protein